MNEAEQFSLFANDAADDHANLIQKFGWSPFTVLNSIQADWQARKKYLNWKKK